LRKLSKVISHSEPAINLAETFMPKNIVICCDAVFVNLSNVSNVFKLYSVLCQDNHQIAFYHPGMAGFNNPGLASFSTWWKSVLGLAFGYGHVKFLVDCYSFLMENYEPGDRLFIFGFSRGAYTARGLSALLHMCGLIRKGNSALTSEAIKLFVHRGPERFVAADKFRATFSRPCNTDFMGVWETSSTVGWIFDAVKFPYTSNNPEIIVGRHAVAIDERRSFFRPNLWGPAMPGQDLKQVWFPGVHSDVGGSYVEAESGLSKIALEWMIREAVTMGLLVDESRLRRIMGHEGEDYVRPDPAAVMHSSLGGFWWQPELIPTRMYDTSRIPPKKVWRLPLGRRRYISEGSLIHESVFRRMGLVPNYDPPNLPRNRSVEGRIDPSGQLKLDRFVNTWLEVQKNKIDPDVWYFFNINIGPRRMPETGRPRSSTSSESESFVQVMVTLFSRDFEIEPRKGMLKLFSEGTTDVFRTRIKARRQGPCRIEIIVTSVDDLNILQRATSELVVGNTEPSTLYA
jgi:uncharacterized protein (DUF2235 family)